MRIIPLSEGSFTIDKTKIFVPFNNNTEQLNSRPVGSLLVEIQPFVIVTEKDIILIDTGLGYLNPDGSSQLHENMIAAGINPSQVTKVLMSHLHKDHAGGITIHSKNAEERFISFPYATYYVQKREFEYAMAIGTSSYILPDFELLEEFSKVVWLTENEGWIDETIYYQITATLPGSLTGQFPQESSP